MQKGLFIFASTETKISAKSGTPQRGDANKRAVTENKNINHPCREKWTGQATLS